MAEPVSYEYAEAGRRQSALKVLSLGWLAAAGLAHVVLVIAWLADTGIPLTPSLLLASGALLFGLVTYLLARAGIVRFTGYFFVSCTVLFSAAMTLLFGGVHGPLAVFFLLPIMVTGLVVGIRAGFVTATAVTAVYLLLLAVERSGLVTPVVTSDDRGVMLYLSVIAYILIFYLVAFMGWFAASRLEGALREVRKFAGELQASNEKLQASEEELRASNEELEAANEELRATEEELRASNEELEATNQELREAQEQLIRSEKLAAIGQLAGGVGHELRNPLGAIKNAVYYIRGKIAGSALAAQEPRVMQFLDIDDEEINSSSKIINDLLDFSRVRKPAVSPSRIGMVIDDAIARSNIPENVATVRKVGESLPEVDIDTEQIRQVLVNIMTNAVQAMPRGGQLTVGAKTKDGFMEVAVTDTGQGIPEESLSKIFDPLFTTKARGIGLGLAVCKSIMERHDGGIRVESGPGRGTTFTVRLPLRVKPALEP